jgi:hypothetical protein
MRGRLPATPLLPGVCAFASSLGLEGRGRGSRSNGASDILALTVRGAGRMGIVVVVVMEEAAHISVIDSRLALKPRLRPP